MQTIKSKNRRVLFPGDLDPTQARGLVDLIENKDYHVVSTLKDHPRSIVKRVEVQGRDVVYKIPTEKNTRWWIRFLTLFRQGEAFKNAAGMELLLAKGFKTTRPLVACEYRRWGMVVDSWLLYEYLEGESCLDKPATYASVVQLLAKLHAAHIMHGDPQIRNFIRTGNDLYIIDANPKTSRSPFERAYEYAYLKKSAPGIEQHFGEMQNKLWYKYAIQHDRFDRKLARFRRRLKGWVGLN